MRQAIFVWRRQLKYEKRPMLARVVELVGASDWPGFDPEVLVHAHTCQVDDDAAEIPPEGAAAGSEVLIATPDQRRWLTTSTRYLSDNGVEVRHLHNETVDTVEQGGRVDRLKLAILDANKEGFCIQKHSHNEPSRPIRHLNLTAAPSRQYADVVTNSMRRAIGETERRR